MARRSNFVAIAAVATAIVAATAYAATPGTTPTLTSAQYAANVTLAWTPSAGDPPDTQQAWRGNGGCAAIPIGGATAVATTGNTAADNNVPDGTYCYYVEADTPLNVLSPVAYSGGLSVTVDTANPTGTVAANPFGAPNFLRGDVTISGTSDDAGSGVNNNVFHHSNGGTCEAGPAGADWDTTASADGTYTVCNVVTDNAGHIATVDTETYVVDNTDPLGSVLTPVPGAAVSGLGNAATGVALTTDAADATAGVRNVQWRWQGATGNPHNIGNAITNPNNGYQRFWNTATGNGHPNDGPVTVQAVITDNAGNQSIATTPVLVDNTAPDGKAVVTAPPAVAGSPTLTWTPAHDAVGINHYDVLRGTAVIGTLLNVPGAATYAFNDKNAPDQATSTYTVRAYDGAGHFLDSDPVSILVDSTSQTAPKNVAAATPTHSAPVLNWQAPTTFAVADYDIYRDGLLIASTTGPATTFTDATATEGAHDYAVLARDAASKPGVLSSSFKVVLDTTAPASGGAPTAQVQTDGQVLLAWPAASDALSGVAGYSVRRANGGVPPATPDGGTAVCAPAAPACTDTSTATGTWSYGVFATDAAGNVALIGTVANVAVVDKLAPLAPTKLKVTRPRSKTPSTTISLTLRWVKPTAPDLDRVVVVLNLKHAPKGPADGKAVYHGLGTSTKLKLRAGQTGYIAIYAYDHTGNVSLKPARTLVTLAALIPLRPLNNSTVRTSTPLLSWKAQKGTVYYNVQLFHKGKKLFVRWPEKASYRIPKGKLKPGTYVWYVWPAVKGKNGKLTFGSLIGRATFVYKKK